MSPSRAGFTLIELLIALAILAIVAVLGYRAIASLTASEAQLSVEARYWQDLDAMFARLEADMREALPRSVRTEAGVEPPWVGEVDGDGNALLRFSRAGPEFNLEAGSGGQRIGYRLRNGSAEVLYWPRFDQPSDATPNAYALANGIAQLHIDYLDPSGNWLERWPPSRDSGLPRAVHVSTTLAAGGVVDRYFTLQ